MIKKNNNTTEQAGCEGPPAFIFTLFVVFLSLIKQLMVNCLLALIGLFPGSFTVQTGVPPVTVAMTTAGTPATGGKFCSLML